MDLNLILIVSLIVIIISLVIFISIWVKKNKLLKKTVPGNTIWLLWFEGFDKSPYVVKKVVESWKKHNQNWNLELISEENLHTFIHIPHHIVKKRKLKIIKDQAFSDIVRLSILNYHGGIWGDATLLCLRPLDDWIYQSLAPTGFWMYRGYRERKGPASWFIASIKGNYMIKTWYQSMVQFWKYQVNENYNYFWMHDLFFKELESNERFRTIWNHTPFLDFEEESHLLANKGFFVPVSDEIKNIIYFKCPYVMKLSKNEEIKTDTNADFLINFSLEMPRDFNNFTPLPIVNCVPFNLLPFLTSIDNFKPPSSLLIVIADCNDISGLKKIKDLLIKKKSNASIVCFDKCNFAKNVPPEFIAKTFKNVGREQHTWLYFIILQYDSLPENVIFISSSIDKWDRYHYMQKMLDNNSPMCNRGEEKDGNFTLDLHFGPVKKAQTRPFSNWFSKNISQWNPTGSKVCWNGWARVSKDQILRHPKDFYQNLLTQLESDANPEEGHFMERVMGDIFNL